MGILSFDILSGGILSRGILSRGKRSVLRHPYFLCPSLQGRGDNQSIKRKGCYSSFEENAFSPQPMKRVITPELPRLPAPPTETSLPEEYMRDDFWDRLSKNKDVQEGVCGEWVKGKAGHLTFEGLLCLRDGEWVNGDLIDAYLQHICRRNGTNLVSPHIDSKENTDDYAPDNRIQYIPTFALSRYKTKKQISSKWYWKMEGVELVLAPVHINKSHWAMSFARMQKKEIIVMDSINNGRAGSTKKDFMNMLLNILMDAADQFAMDIGKREDWTLKELLDVPQQQNGIDCGIFSLLFAYYEVDGRCMDFTQEHISYFRRKICRDLLPSQ
ncbi:unnamed protein product [Meloidogyne enterolobii]|uniref:Uncharacterized protein n=1 Tax=Meloidogyne enterolobii TaxID=390850 RepID=A0ACB0YXR2_MELEN